LSADASSGDLFPEPEVEASGAERRVRFGSLLIVVFAAFLLSGLSQPGHLGEAIRVLLNGATLILALIAAEANPKVIRGMAVFVVVAAIGGLYFAFAGHAPDEATGRGIDALLIGVAIPVVALGTMRALRKRGTVTVEAVFGVLSIYILFGMFFAAVLGFISELSGTPVFDGETAVQTSSVAHCIYYSFTTLTTVGYGDLTTKTNLTHTLSVCEALVGQIYLVTVVSLIVSNLGQSHGLRPRGDRARET
jgi:hypothetical protein